MKIKLIIITSFLFLCLFSSINLVSPNSVYASSGTFHVDNLGTSWTLPSYESTFSLAYSNFSPSINDFHRIGFYNTAVYGGGAYWDYEQGSSQFFSGNSSGASVLWLTRDQDLIDGQITYFHIWNSDFTQEWLSQFYQYNKSTGTFTEISNVPPSVDTVNVTESPSHVNTPITASANFFDYNKSDTHTATWNWGDGNSTPGTLTESSASGSVTNTHTYSTAGTYTITLTVTDNNGADGENGTSETIVKQITTLNPTNIYISKGLLNIGVKFDIRAEVYEENTLVSSGEIDSFNPGTSATLATIPFNSFTPIDFPSGSALKIVLYARNACTGSLLNSGTAKLYYNAANSDSKFGATIGLVNSTYHLLNGFILGQNSGTSQKTVSVAAGAKCSPFKPFGTWTTTP